MVRERLQEHCKRKRHHEGEHCEGRVVDLVHVACAKQDPQDADGHVAAVPRGPRAVPTDQETHERAHVDLDHGQFLGVEQDAEVAQELNRAEAQETSSTVNQVFGHAELL